MALDYLPNPNWAVIYGEVPAADKWSELGENDNALATGAGWDDDAVKARHLTNQIVGAEHLALNPSRGYVSTTQTTTSSTFTNLATVGPSITVNVGPNGMLLIGCAASVSNDTTNNGGAMALDLTGANTLAADQNLTGFGLAVSNPTNNSRTNLLTGLTPGSTTIVAKYRRYGGGGTATFSERYIYALPL